MTHPDDTHPRLTELGWDEGFARTLAAGLVPGRVVAQHRALYRVAAEERDLDATLAGRLRHASDDASALPAVGDWVAMAPSADGAAAVAEVLPRRSAFARRRPGAGGAQVIAANIDVALVAAPLTEPLNARRLERFVALAWESGAVPLVVLTKRDLCADAEAALAAARSAAPGTDVVAISTVTGEGMELLGTHLRPRRTAVVLGQSGVGKSTLVNALAGEERLRTFAIRGDGRGRHTTTHRELVRLPGGALLIDTPGLREVGLWDAADGVRAAFGEVDEVARRCRFGDCRHDGEPGCAVEEAVRGGTLDPDRVHAWRRLEREIGHRERGADPVVAAGWKSEVKAAQRALRSHLQRKRF